MADTCTCSTEYNIACSGSAFGVNVYQPTCQMLPDLTRVENPYYASDINTTFISYGVSTHCGDFPPVGEVGTVVYFFVPICENIPLSAVLSVEETLDACLDFNRVTFDFNNTSGIQPPAGLQFLRIFVNSSFGTGGSGIYRIALAGNYPAVTTASGNDFRVITTERGYNFGIEPFTFAGCPAIPRVTVVKTCDVDIVDNMATVNYNIDVDNTGGTILTNVIFSDMVSFDGVDITLGTITVSPSNVIVDASRQGVVFFGADLGSIGIGEFVNITYSIPLVNFSIPNTFSFNNMAIVRSDESQGSMECMTEVEVVSYQTDVCCDVNNDTATFMQTVTSVGNSPDSMISMTSSMTIPESVTIQLISSQCTATFDNGEPVPVDVDLNGVNINFSCDALMSIGSMVQFPIEIRFIGIDNFNNANLDIPLTIETFELQGAQQILLGVDPLPNEEILSISRMLTCD